MEKFHPFSLNLSGCLFEIDRPLVMGILNVTNDSFYLRSRNQTVEEIAHRVEEMVAAGVDIIDVGGYSSRPGADNIPLDEELRRVLLGVSEVRKISRDIPVSVDTFRSEVAREAIAGEGADIINDISGGTLDDRMFETVAELGVPYILMHLRGTPATMQELTDYSQLGVTATVLHDLSTKINRLALLGVNDIIVDPGFGFSKTLDQNYELLSNLPSFRALDCPVLVGVSRKSMISRVLGIGPEEALNGTTVLNSFALDRGASILRVHDAGSGVDAVRLYCKLNNITYRSGIFTK